MSSWLSNTIRRVLGHRDGPIPVDRGDRGEWGEELALQWLRKERGMSLLERNWRCGKAEIDLIMRDGPVLAIVEVRTRKAGGLVPPVSTISGSKWKRLRSAGWAYSRALKPQPTTIRFDVVSIEVEGVGTSVVRHYENVSPRHRRRKV